EQEDGRWRAGRAQDAHPRQAGPPLHRRRPRRCQGGRRGPNQHGCADRLSAGSWPAQRGGHAMISGIFTAILLVVFLGLWAWAWSKRRRQDFDEAAQLPLADDQEI